MKPVNSVQKGTYKHYKGNYYQVIDVALCSETLQELVVYRALHGEQTVWVRPFNMFMEHVEFAGEQVPRFAFVSEQGVTS